MWPAPPPPYPTDVPEIEEETPTPPLRTSPAPPAPPPAPAPQFADPQPFPLVPPKPPAFPFPLAPPVAPAFPVLVLFAAKPPRAIAVENVEFAPLFPGDPLAVAGAAPPAPTFTTTFVPGVTEKLVLEITSPPPPPCHQ